VLVATWLRKLHVRDTRRHCPGPGRSRDEMPAAQRKRDRHLERPGPCISPEAGHRPCRHPLEPASSRSCARALASAQMRAPEYRSTTRPHGTTRDSRLTETADSCSPLAKEASAGRSLTYVLLVPCERLGADPDALAPNAKAVATGQRGVAPPLAYRRQRLLRSDPRQADPIGETPCGGRARAPGDRYLSDDP
jgi:hypothetical protein